MCMCVCKSGRGLCAPMYVCMGRLCGCVYGNEIICVYVGGWGCAGYVWVFVRVSLCTYVRSHMYVGVPVGCVCLCE